MARKSTELRPIMTRIPESLRRRLEREAARNARSMNSEIIHRLERSLDRQDVIQDFVAALDDLRRAGEGDFDKFDYKTYFLVNRLLGLKPRSREEWEELPDAPTDEEFEAMKRAHGDA
jgi:hypothetical protein